MRWFSRKPKPKLYCFWPLPDITADELAVILKHVHGHLAAEIGIYDDAMIPAEIMRHFRPVS